MAKPIQIRLTSANEEKVRIRAAKAKHSVKEEANILISLAISRWEHISKSK